MPKGNVKTLRAERLKGLVQAEPQKTQKELLIDAGYSESYARTSQIKSTQQYKVMEKDLLNLVRDKKRLLLEGLTEKKIQGAGVGAIAAAAKNVGHIEEWMEGRDPGATKVLYLIQRGDHQITLNATPGNYLNETKND